MADVTDSRAHGGAESLGHRGGFLSTLPCCSRSYRGKTNLREFWAKVHDSRCIGVERGGGYTCPTEGRGFPDKNDDLGGKVV